MSVVDVAWEDFQFLRGTGPSQAERRYQGLALWLPKSRPGTISSKRQTLAVAQRVELLFDTIPCYQRAD